MITSQPTVGNQPDLTLNACVRAVCTVFTIKGIFSPVLPSTEVNRPDSRLFCILSPLPLTHCEHPLSATSSFSLFLPYLSFHITVAVEWSPATKAQAVALRAALPPRCREGTAPHTRTGEFASLPISLTRRELLLPEASSPWTGQYNKPHVARVTGCY